MSSGELSNLFDSKINIGNNLLKYLSKIEHVRGVPKLKKKINQEIRFLRKVLNSGTAKKEHALTSNITWYDALVSVIKEFDNVVAVLEVFTLKQEEEIRKICVDIVTKNGYEWIKVIAKNVKNVISFLEGDCSYGKRTYIDQARELLTCAEQNNIFFKTPKVVFQFTRGVNEETVKCLTDIGINVKEADCLEDIVQEERTEGEDATCELDSIALLQKQHYFLSHMSDVTHLNLDVTTMLAYVSDLCNGGCHFEFDDPCIKYQAEQEREAPLRPLLDKLFKGKRLICCQSAYESFSSIINMVGGQQEKERASELMKNIAVVNDVVPKELEDMKLGGKIKKRSLCVFSTGYAMESVTVTANEGFYRSALNKGMKFAVFVHQPRALTENMRKKKNSSEPRLQGKQESVTNL